MHVARVGVAHGADASHRGGNPGFVRADSPHELSWPDYSGNSMFLTLGNLAYTNDFRSTYSTILERWFAVEAKPIVNGTFEQFAFV